ncbi:NUDIX hydrolase [Clostridium sp. MB40-C1]|uniref:NUDIX hydrolase n=1 Tax=Clostridium sp. MB40-C1 TaxID=3070996 RepID=UPI0027E182A3|nr:NUDIX hydrolase [Clostridium sp. MB40-C1]WMJ81873.1 NUDIX hydrolase [Clostridium sp. MB40-C1]
MKYLEKTLEEKNQFKGKIITLDIKTVELPNGKISEREIVKHPGGVAILAYKTDDTIILVEQFRSPIEKNLLEIPAGKLEKGEDIETCCRRELEEETGYKAGRITFLGKIVTSPGFCDECIYIFKAEDLYEGQIGGDEDEFINLYEVEVEKVKDMIKKGEIIDAKTISAFMLI